MNDEKENKTTNIFIWVCIILISCVYIWAILHHEIQDLAWQKQIDKCLKATPRGYDGLVVGLVDMGSYDKLRCTYVDTFHSNTYAPNSDFQVNQTLPFIVKDDVELSDDWWLWYLKNVR